MKATARFLLFHLLILVVLQSGAQEYAIDFTRTDCKGVEHQLFSELDSGKVIILDFVMLGCSPCFWATRDLDTIVKAFESTHPGRVKIYSFSYEDTHTCEQMFDWRTAGGFTDVTLFTQGAEMVGYYGGMGMPSIVVTGSSLHKVFYNGYGYFPTDDSLITAAIENALIYDQSGENELIAHSGFKIFPTLFSDRLYVEADENLAGSIILFYDSFGRKLMSATIPSTGKITISTSGLSKGLYFARIKAAGKGLTEGFKLIRQ